MSDRAVGAAEAVAGSPNEPWDAVQVFSATTPRAREGLGERVNEWLRANHDRVRAVDNVVLQSSDAQHHCITVVVFLRAIARG